MMNTADSVHTTVNTEVDIRKTEFLAITKKNGFFVEKRRPDAIHKRLQGDSGSFKTNGGC